MEKWESGEVDTYPRYRKAMVMLDRTSVVEYLYLAEVSMTPEQFDEAIRMLRSPDLMTYEDGYQWLQGDNLKRYAQQIVELLRSDEVLSV